MFLQKTKDIDTNIDYDFILSHEKDTEGGFSGKAFVPTDNDGKPLGKSGITFACGVDIGQMNKLEAKSLCGERHDLYEQISDYVGVKGKPAQKLLKAKPLEITQADMFFLAQEKYAEIYNQLKNYYGKDFDKLPAPARTVLLSVAVQYGANLPARTPRFWQQAIKQNWQAVIKELRDFGDDYKSRRFHEADYLESALAVNKETPSIL